MLAAIGAAAWPVTARAQLQRGSARLGVLTTTSEHDPEWKSEKAAFLQAMSGFGWTEGRNLHVDYRFGAGDRSRLAEAGRELVNLKPDVLLARSPTSVKALLAETRRIPIVFVSVSDPVGERFAASLARPGGNVTGFTNVEPTMAGKWLELLREIAPQVGRVGVLYNPNVAVGGGAFFLRAIESAAPSFALSFEIASVHTVADMEQVVEALARSPDGGLVVPPDVFIVANRAAMIALAARHRVPAVYAFRNMAAEGGLLSYGVDVADLYRRSAAYVDRILRGADPGDLPIQAPTRFELVINLGTARALGLQVPRELLLRADEVIE